MRSPQMKKLFSIFVIVLIFSSAQAYDKAVNDKISVALNQFQGFQENKGQFSDTNYVLFQLISKGSNVYVTTSGISYCFTKMEKEAEKEEKEKMLSGKKGEEKAREIKWSKVDMNLAGASISRNNLHVEAPTANKIFNYYLANCPEGALGISNYQKIIFTNIYPGIDWVLNSTADGFKYDFIVHPNADPSIIKIKYDKNFSLKRGGEDSYSIKTPYGKLTEGELFCFQNNTEKTVIASKYEIEKNNVSILVSEYDHTKDLIIDPPVLTWSTYFGGAEADGPLTIATDKSGNLFIAGYTYSVVGPLLNPMSGAYYQATNTGVYFGHQAIDIFIAKFDNAGVLIWATYYGGTVNETANDMVIDPSGNVYITGNSYSADFPLQNMAGAYYKGALGGTIDAVILKFNNIGVRQWATFYGGNTAFEDGYGIEIDPSGNIFIGGYTQSSDLPIVPFAGYYNQPTITGGFGRDLFLTRFNSSGVLQWSTYYGGSGWEAVNDIKSDNCGNIYITGWTESPNFPIQNWPGAYNQPAIAVSSPVNKYDGFIIRLSAAGAWQWSTYFGGNETDIFGELSTDKHGNVFVTGTSSSSNFPIQNLPGAYNQATNTGSSDGIIVKFDKSGVLNWSALIGGANSDFLGTITINELGELYLSGTSVSTNFPTQQPGGAYYDNTFGGGNYDIVALKFTSTGLLNWSTYFGGMGDEWNTGIAYASNGKIYLTGEFVDLSGVPTLSRGGLSFFQSAPVGSPTSKHSGHLIYFDDPIILPVINFSLTPACFGNTTHFTYTGTVDTTEVENWIWTFGDPASGTSNSSSLKDPSHIFSAPGNYTVTQVAGYYCLYDTVKKFLTVNSLPVPNAGTNKTVCSGTIAQLSVANASNYLWSPSASLSNSSISNPVATPNSNTKYYVIVTDVNGCTNKDSVQINISPLITITLNSSSLACVPTGSISAIAAGGSGALTYNWSPGGYSTSGVSGLSAGTYTLTITDALGCSLQNTTTITPSAPSFTISISTNNVSCFIGNNGSAQIITTGGGGNYTYSLEPFHCTNNFSNYRISSRNLFLNSYRCCGMHEGHHCFYCAAPLGTYNICKCTNKCFMLRK